MISSLNELKQDNQFYQLGESYFSEVRPEALSNSHLISFNNDVADLLDLDHNIKNQSDFLAFAAGQSLLPDSKPLAMVYAGHQFGHFVPQLGDGRAILLTQIRNTQNQSWDLQLKGAGLTPYSRDGDGRAVLRSSIREYLCGEAMHGLGIASTRALCLLGSDEEVYREQIETGAVLLRVAPSHVRFGSFEFFYHGNQHQQLKPLADHVIDEHFPELKGQPDCYLRWLDKVIQLTAVMIAQWQAVGFAHGVMNTDNMSVLGLTMDYGPYGFLDAYNPDFICNHSDYHGRYAFKTQPKVALWNLSCFAQAILPLLSDNPEQAAELAIAALKNYEPLYAEQWLGLMRSKLGLVKADEHDAELIESLLQLLAKNQIDYSIFFRSLCAFKTNNEDHDLLTDPFNDKPGITQWLANYKQRLMQENSGDKERKVRMLHTNPAIILRNYLAQQVIEAADQGDYQPLENLLTALKTPFSVSPETAIYTTYPPDWADKISVSCSS